MSANKADKDKKKQAETTQAEVADKNEAAETKASEEIKAEAEKTVDDAEVAGQEPYVVKLPDDAKKQKKPKRKERREIKKNKVLDITTENDIKYRGPLNYRCLKAIGWASLAFAQYVHLMELKQSIIGTEGSVALGSVANGLITSLGLPLILIANFAIILNGKDRYKGLLILNGGVAGFYAFVFWLLYHRYALGLLATFQGDRMSAAVKLDQLIAEDPSFNGYLTFNVFLDMFLLILFMYFLNYTPKKKFQGDKLIYFRLLAILPMLYEALCILLRLLATGGKIVIPVAVYPFLTTKPPLAFVMFIWIAFYVRGMEKRFRQNGKTHEEYQAFVKTNTNSFMFSKKLAKLIAIFAVIDFVLSVVIIVWHTVSAAPNLEDEAAISAAAMDGIKWAEAWGNGDMVTMVLAIPIVLLFSYTKPRILKIPDILIPVLGVIAIVFIYLEGIYQILQGALEKSMDAMMQMGG